MSKANQVDGYIRKQKKWHAELQKLREIILDSGLTEDVKWRVPCYTFEGNNVCLINALKDYCAIAFMKGSLLKDAKKVLIRPGENTRAARMIRFTSVDEVEKLESTLKAYIREAIELEKSGAKVDFKKDAELPIPAEVQKKINEMPGLKAAFEALTPGRRRAWIMHFAAPKQSATRESRVEKAAPLIFKGLGMNDEYLMSRKRTAAQSGAPRRAGSSQKRSTTRSS